MPRAHVAAGKNIKSVVGVSRLARLPVAHGLTG